MGILEIKAEDNETNQQEWQAQLSPRVQSRVDFAGTIITAVNDPPVDADLVANECAWWFDSSEGASKVMFKAKDETGAVVVGALPLDPP